MLKEIDLLIRHSFIGYENGDNNNHNNAFFCIGIKLKICFDFKFDIVTFLLFFRISSVYKELR